MELHKFVLHCGITVFRRPIASTGLLAGGIPLGRRVCGLGAALIMGTVALGAENLVPSGDFEDVVLAKEWGPENLVTLTDDESRGGSMALRFIHPGWANSPEIVPVDPLQTYQLHAFIKEPEVQMNPDYVPLRVFIGLRLLDENQEQIPPFAVRAVLNSETTLARDAGQGDTKLYLEGTPWEAGVHPGIAFDIQDDFRDIPNFNSIGIIRIRPEQEGFSIDLQQPLPFAYPAGTRVRQHRYADFPVLTAEPGAAWDAQLLEIGGQSEPGRVEPAKFWPGTRYVRVSIAPSARETGLDPGTVVDLLVDDVSLIQLGN